MAYTPRLNAPSTNDRRWINVDYNGYNRCIVIGQDGSVLPNCTGYTHGRAMEIAGVTSDTLGLSFRDAVYYWYDSSTDWIRTQTPSLGAVLCFGQGSSIGTPGHVCIVERIIDNDTIITSDSNYNAERFVLRTRHRSLDWNFYSGSPLVCLGFLKNPYVDGASGGNFKLPLFARHILAARRARGKGIKRL